MPAQHSHPVVAVMSKLGFVVWIVMGRIGGVSLASFYTMLNISSITPNSGKKDPLKMFHCATWAMFSYLVTQAQVVHVQRMTTCLEIAA
jgi:hypothetical protein